MLDLVAGGTMSVALARLYGAEAFGPAALNNFFASHISDLKASEVELVHQTGMVLDAATAGYGIGYVGSTAILAAGQLMLGNTLSAAATVGTAAAFSNPAAATCAAVGAVYYGYHALSDDERNMLIKKLQDGLAIGRELITSIISYVQNSLTKMLDADLLKTLRSYVVEYANLFGRSFVDITNSVSDRIVLLAHKAAMNASEAAETIGAKFYSGAVSISDFGSEAGGSVMAAGAVAGNWASDAGAKLRQKVSSLKSKNDSR